MRQWALWHIALFVAAVICVVFIEYSVGEAQPMKGAQLLIQQAASTLNPFPKMSSTKEVLAFTKDSQVSVPMTVSHLYYWTNNTKINAIAWIIGTTNIDACTNSQTDTHGWYFVARASSPKLSWATQRIRAPYPFEAWRVALFTDTVNP